MKTLDRMWRVGKFFGEDDQRELAVIFSELENKIEAVTTVKLIREDKEDFAVHDIDREMLTIYFEKARRGIFGDNKIGIEPNLPYAEIVLKTVEKVFNGKYLTKNYVSPDEEDGYHYSIIGRWALEDALQTVNKLKKNIGEYSALMYGMHKQQIVEAFRKIILHLCESDIERHGHELEKETGADFNLRFYVNTTINRIKRAVSYGTIDLHLLLPIIEDSGIYNEDWADKNLRHNDSTRKAAEKFIIDLNLLKTVGERYQEYQLYKI